MLGPLRLFQSRVAQGGSAAGGEEPSGCLEGGSQMDRGHGEAEDTPLLHISSV